MISVFGIFRVGDKQATFVAWTGHEKSAPEDCIILEQRGGTKETHYWVTQAGKEPDEGTKCLCGKEEYKKEKKKDGPKDSRSL